MLRLQLQWVIYFLWIIKGQTIEPKSIDITKASYQVAVEVGGKVRCGGTIVNHLWIITAASCFLNIPNVPLDVQVRAGTARKLFKGSFHWALNVITHPQFNESSNDIALIELATPLKFKRSIQPITLASRPPKEKSEGRMTGWGTFNNVISTKEFVQLLQVPVIIMNKTTCEELHNNNNLICVNDEISNLSTCDRGGPLVVGRQLVGLAVDCHSSAFTDVSQYKMWILQTIYKYH